MTSNNCRHLVYKKTALPSGVHVIYCTRCNTIIGEAINTPIPATIANAENDQPSLFQ